MLVKEEVKPEVNSGVNTTAKFTAWSKHCCRFYDALAELLVDRKYILAKDIVTAYSLVTDIQMLTKKVPFEGKNMDMTKDLFYWVSMSIRGHELRDLFIPPET